jgi:Tol biopolymer transport system component
VPTDAQSGRVLFVRDQALYAVPFDPVRRVLTGEEVQIAAPVGSFRDGALFSATANVLVYRGIIPDVQLQWRRRNGEALGSVGEPGPYSGAALSPDGSKVALLRDNRVSRADQDVWILDLNRDATTRLTSDPLLESVPAWTPDGKAVFIVVGHGAGDIWMQPIDGSPRTVVFQRSAHPELRVNPLLATLSVSDRGRLVVFPVEAADRAQTDLWTLSPGDRSIAPLVQQDFAQTHGTISPDGRWLAYASNESGVSEVFVRALTRTANRPPQVVGSAIPVSRGGGTAPRWRGDNKELFYLSPAGGVFAATVSGGEIGRPVQLFRAPGALTSWSVSADGQRMLLAIPAGEPRPMTVVLNWQSAIGR